MNTDDFQNTFMIQVGVLIIFILNMLFSYLKNGKVILFKRDGYLYVFLYFCFVVFSVVYCEVLNPED